MIAIIEKKDCCGCTACASVCGKNAITMIPDNEGFLYPTINVTLCVDCGLCNKVCAFQNGYNIELNLEEPLVYAVRHKNEVELTTSRSGGMFIAISDYILGQGGVVYGAGYTDHFRVVHKRATTAEERNEFKGSKYVQSVLNTIFQQVKSDLNKGNIVLFSGTPCQTAGLRSFLQKTNTSNLFLCDIVCHGTPSPYIWRDYLAYIERKYKDTISKVDFRDKQMGWSAHFESFILESSGKKIMSQTFKNLFFAHEILRPSCNVCKYSNLKRPSDITLADYWGWQKISSTFNEDDRGVSLVLINTEKGNFVFNEVKSHINFLVSNTANCLQPNLERPSSVSPLREKFWKDYYAHGFIYVAKRYGDLGWRYKIKRLLNKINIRLKKIINK